MEIALRRPCAEDLAAYQQIRNSPYVMQYNCMSPLDEAVSGSGDGRSPLLFHRLWWTYDWRHLFFARHHAL